MSLEQRHHCKDPGGLWNHPCPTAAEVGPCRGRGCFFLPCIKMPLPLGTHGIVSAERRLSLPLPTKGSFRQAVPNIVSSKRQSLEGLMLKLQYFGHLMQRTDSLGKTMMLGKTEGRRSGLRMKWLDGTMNSMDRSLSKLREMLKDRKAWLANLVTEQQGDSPEPCWKSRGSRSKPGLLVVNLHLPPQK